MAEKEYIEREALTKHLRGACVAKYPSSFTFGIISAAEEVEKMPTADVVEVVRCKDCKWSGMYAFGDSDTEVLACLDIEDDGFVRFATRVDPNGYCSHGERREHG